MGYNNEYNFRCEFGAMVAKYTKNELTYAELEQWVVDKMKLS